MFNSIFRLLDPLLIALGAVISYSLLGKESLGGPDFPRLTLAFIIVLSVLIFRSQEVYGAGSEKSCFAAVSNTLLSFLAVLLITMAVLTQTHSPFRSSIPWLGGWMLISVAMLISFKVLAWIVRKRLRIIGYGQKRVALVATARDSQELVNRIQATRNNDFWPVAVFDETATSDAPVAGMRVVRTIASLQQIVRQHGIAELWLTGHPSKPSPINQLMSTFRHDFVNIRFVPNLAGLAMANADAPGSLGLPAINLVVPPQPDGRVTLKHACDRVWALLFLLVASPLMLMIAIAVKQSSPGPVFFRQKRRGIDGNEFLIYKFRSMRQHIEGEGKLTQAQRGDHRITRVGAFLRKTSLDELPQFINVLKGEMSIVGPRPHAIQHDEQYKELVENYMYRYRIKPGITGWAQVNGFRGETDRVEKMVSRVDYDLFYIRHWTFKLDLKIMLMTVVKGFIGSNAY